MPTASSLLGLLLLSLSLVACSSSSSEAAAAPAAAPACTKLDDCTPTADSCIRSVCTKLDACVTERDVGAVTSVVLGVLDTKDLKAFVPDYRLHLEREVVVSSGGDLNFAPELSSLGTYVQLRVEVTGTTTDEDGKTYPITGTVDPTNPRIVHVRTAVGGSTRITHEVKVKVTAFVLGDSPTWCPTPVESFAASIAWNDGWVVTKRAAD